MVSSTVRFAAMTKVSLPAPPLKLSLPEPAVMLSLPSPPDTMSLPVPPASVSLPPLPESVFATVAAPFRESLPEPPVNVWAASDTPNIVKAPVRALASTVVARMRGEAPVPAPAVRVSVPEPPTVIAPAKVVSAELVPVTVSARVSMPVSITRSSTPFAVAEKFDSDTLAVSVDPDTTLLA